LTPTESNTPKTPLKSIHSSTVLARAAATIQLESDSIRQLIDKLDEDFVETVRAIIEAPGRVVFTGIGKSAHIAQKLVATLNSTGTPSLFLHAAEAIHGDLGLVQRGDVVICISKSGNSPEIKALVPLLKSMGHDLTAMVGNRDSPLAQHADRILDISVEREACPHDLAPTSSTAAQLAMGDALAMCLMDARGFTASDFATYHPGGALGKRLYTRLDDLIDKKRAPQVGPNALLNEVVLSMSAGRSGAAVVLDEGTSEILGMITDGDLRRALERGVDADTKAIDIMGTNPVTGTTDMLAVKAFALMEQHAISQIPVIDQGGYCGIIHLHDLLKEGIF
jgi:arabinose-5-phosphate isomerase